MEVDLGWLCALVRRHCPVFFLHPADRYLPCSVQFFMRHSELRVSASSSGAQVLLPRGSVSGPLLVEAQRQQPHGSRLWLDLDPAARGGETLDTLHDVPVYCHPKAVVDCNGQIESLEITYITLYAFNGAYRVGGLPFLQTGAHDGDIEHLTVRVHPTSGALQGVWYNAHRSRDGHWVPAAAVPYRHGRIAAFVALHGHGCYSQPGRMFRHFFLGNDLCSDSGPVWLPRRVILLPAVAGAAPESGTRLHLLRVLSRGCLLPRAEDIAPSIGSSGGANVSTGSAVNGKCAEGTADTIACSDGASLPAVVTDECSAWLQFTGDWGTVPGPAFQQWWNKAECPVSRTPILRVIGHVFPERESVLS